MSRNEAADALRRYMKDDGWEHGISLLDEALGPSAEWDCPNCGERITSHVIPPTLDTATDLFAIEYLGKRATEIAAQAMHRWKHPTRDIDRDHCSCREDAQFAVSLALKPEMVVTPVDPER